MKRISWTVIVFELQHIRNFMSFKLIGFCSPDWNEINRILQKLMKIEPRKIFKREILFKWNVWCTDLTWRIHYYEKKKRMLDCTEYPVVTRQLIKLILNGNDDDKTDRLLAFSVSFARLNVSNRMTFCPKASDTFRSPTQFFIRSIGEFYPVGIPFYYVYPLTVDKRGTYHKLLCYLYAPGIIYLLS